MTIVSNQLSLGLLQCFIAATGVVFLAVISVTLLRRQSASFRHRVWVLSMTAAIVLPACMMLLPDLGPPWPTNRGDVGRDPIAGVNIEQGRVTEDVLTAAENIMHINRPAGRLEHESFDGANREASLRGMESVAHAKHHPGGWVYSAQPEAAMVTAGAGPRASVQNWSRFPITVGLFGVWLIGLAVGLFVLARNSLAASRIVRRAVPINDVATTSIRDHLCASGGIRGDVSLLCSTETAIPFTVGCFRSVIVLPSGYGQWTAERLRVVLAHEMAHIQRRDVLAQLIARLACTFYWCHPLIWLAGWRMRVEREFACDDAVLEMGEAPSKYADLLVDVAAALNPAAMPPVYAVAMARTNRLEQRIHAILHPCLKRAPIAPTTSRVLVAGTLAVVVALGLMSPSSSQDTNATDNSGSTALNENADGTGDRTSSAESRDVDADSSANQATTEETAVIGIVVDEQGRPVDGAVVSVRYFRGKASSTTDSRGRFELAIPNSQVGGAPLFGTGPNDALGFVQLPWKTKAGEAISSPRITLEAPRRIQVNVVHQNGKAAEGIRVVANADQVTIAESTTDAQGRATIAIPKSAPLQFVLADAASQGIDYVLFRRSDQPSTNPYQLAHDHRAPIGLTLSPTRSLKVRVVNQDDKPVAGAQVYPWYVKLPKKGGIANLGQIWMKETDQNGLVSFNNIPVENDGMVTIWVRKEGYVTQERLEIDVATAAPVVTATLLPLVPVTGRVTYPDGTAAAGVEVVARGDSYRFGDNRVEAVTSNAGTFRIDVSPETYCLFAAGDDIQWSSSIEARIVMNEPPENVHLRLQPAKRVFGRLTTKQGDEPIAGEYLRLYQKEDVGNEYHNLPEDERLPNRSGSNTTITPRILKTTRSKEDGSFEFFTGPGSYYLIGPKSMEPRSFGISDLKTIEVNVTADQPLERTLNGRVVLASKPDKGVAGIDVVGYSLSPDGRHLRATTAADGDFEARASRHPQLVGAFSEDRKLGGLVRVEAGTETLLLPLMPTVVLRGTLVSSESGEPAADEEISAVIEIALENNSYNYAFRRRGTTDTHGRFEIAGVVPGHQYRLAVALGRDNDGNVGHWTIVGEAEATKAEQTDIGQLQLTPSYYRAFRDQDQLADRLAHGLMDAKLAYQQVLVFAADPDSNATREFFEARYVTGSFNKGLRSALENFLIIGIDAKQSAFLREVGVTAPNTDGATIAILNVSGKPIVEAKFSQLAFDGKLDRARLTEFLNTRNVPLPDAAQELVSALATALREDKRVLVQISGPGCAPCILLSRYLDSQRSLIEKDYVYVKLDSRMPNAEEVTKNLRPTDEGSIPWTAILSAAGDVLITSDAKEGNIGFPSDDIGKLHFEHMLRSSRRRITDRDIEALLTALE